jgi:phosphoglycerate dehydrogenase-like enzyme
MKHIIMLAGPACEQISNRLRECPGLELKVVKSKEICLAELPDADALLIASPQYDAGVAASLQRHAPRLRWLQILTAGYEGPQIHGVRKGILVTNAGDAWSTAVAEHVFALLLALVKQLPAALDAQRGPAWDRSMATKMAGLSGRTMCIIGYGSIGREIAVRSRAFGMRVVGLSRSVKTDAILDEARLISDLKRSVAESDVVALAVPFSPDTQSLINADVLNSFKRGAILINVARGGVLDTAAVMQALQDGKLAGAGLDVTDPEPLPVDHPLWRCPNLIVTPHVAGAAGDTTWTRLADTVAENVKRFVNNQPLKHIVSWTDA